MTEHVIETRELRKEFRTRHGVHVAVDGLDLAVPAGGVHGFLGPNGSGKTTTIRMLLGLARATSGEMRLFGRPVPDELPAVIGRVGAVVESPKFSPTFTARQNLGLLARAGGVPVDRVAIALTTVGLADRADERYQGYSLGMKQRLAIAATLLKDPALLVLDEPTNGLDPAGIREIREMVRGLGEQGVTVLVSSHLLAEVQQVCTSASIIGRGRLLAQGRVDDLLGGGTSYRVVVTDPEAAVDALREAGLVVRREPGAPPGTLAVDPAGADPALITQVLGERGLWLSELSPVRADLEQVFLDLTSDHTLGTPGDHGHGSHDGGAR